MPEVTRRHNALVRPILIDESSLLDICHVLGADRVELVGTQVTFCKQLISGEGVTWRALLGEYVEATRTTWRIATEVVLETKGLAAA